MHITDPVADMLTRIRNANNAKHETVDVPASNMKKSIAQILLDEGYIKAFQVVEDGTQGVIRITLKYNAGKEKVISGLRRVSKPGLRVYVGADELPRVLRGLGIAIVSTSKGVMTGRRGRHPGRDPHHSEVQCRQGEGHLRPAPRVQARPARLCGRRRAAPRAAWSRHRDRIHFQGRHDRQGCSRSARRRRSPCVRMVRRYLNNVENW